MSDLEGTCTSVCESAREQMAVKVAILDSGCKLEELEGVQKGQSFCFDQEAFFVGPCSDGTEMARCVRDVFPKAELYIARLDDSQMAENHKFTVASCCEVSLLSTNPKSCKERPFFDEQTAKCALALGTPLGNGNGGRHHLHELVFQEHEIQ